MLRIKVNEYESHRQRERNTITVMNCTISERDRTIQQLRIERDLLQRTVADLAVSNRRLTEAYNLGQTVGSAIRRASRSLAAMFQPCKKGI